MSESEKLEKWIQDGSIYIPKLSDLQLKMLVRGMGRTIFPSEANEPEVDIQDHVNILQKKTDEYLSTQGKGGRFEIEAGKIDLRKASVEQLKFLLEAASDRIDSLSGGADDDDAIKMLRDQCKRAMMEIDLSALSPTERIKSLESKLVAAKEELQNLRPTQEQENEITKLKNQLLGVQQQRDAVFSVKAEPRISALQAQVGTTTEEVENLRPTQEQENQITLLKNQLFGVQQQSDAAFAVRAEPRILALEAQVGTAAEDVENLRPTQEQDNQITLLKNQLKDAQQQFDVAIAISSDPRIVGLGNQLANAQLNIAEIGAPHITPLGYWCRVVFVNVFLLLVVCVPLSTTSSVIFGVYSESHRKLNLWLYLFNPIASWGRAAVVVWMGVRASRYPALTCIIPYKWWGCGNEQAIADGLALWAGMIAQIGRVIQIILYYRGIYHYFVLDLSCLDAIAGLIPVMRQMLAHPIS